ncbi:MAG: hypothetical protein WDO13_21915 [Verrucomicrobiota bacterium]
MRLQTTVLPSAPSNPSLPSNMPNFIATSQSDSGPVALSDSSPVYWVIQFTPNGMARNGANPISSIWLGLQPSYGATVSDTKNVASIKVNGLTGLSSIYRE